MRFLHRKQNLSAANAGVFLTVVAVVWCASCGTTPPSFGGEAGGKIVGDGGGGSTTQCTDFSCTPNNGGDDGGFGTTIGPDGGLIKVAPINGPVSDSNCPGALTAASVTSLQAASANSASLKWLYPYNATVFPGGLASPILQWSQTGTPAGVYVHLHSQKYDYAGCFAGSNPPQIKIPEVEWATAYAQSAGKSDPLTVELSTITGSTVSGAIKETWTFAKGSLAGDVYYNTYASKLVPGQAFGGNGAIIQIANGKARAFLYTTGPTTPGSGPCVSCHALSSNGSMLVAQEHRYPGGLYGPGSMSFDLTKTAMPSPATPLAMDTKDDWGMSAVYPDGTMLLTNGQPTDSNFPTFGQFPAGTNDVPGMIGPQASVMYNTSTGATIAFTGLTTPYAMMPMFSTDGKEVVYNDYRLVAGGPASGHTLTMMDYDNATKTFSNAKQLFTDSTRYPGWPFFTPDGKQVIFSLGNGPNFASDQMPPGGAPNAAQLYVVDVASKMSHRLDEASGYSGTTDYLPFPGRDESLDFFPTVNPISAGGYFWVYFTSRRTYGNIEAAGVADAASKSIWVAAVDANPTPGTDPSHPAFYLPGQELGSGNIRAFAVLAPCVGDGTNCESGIDCCGGSCTSGKCGPPESCPGVNDRCTPADPCCPGMGLECIGGYCGYPAPQ